MRSAGEAPSPRAAHAAAAHAAAAHAAAAHAAAAHAAAAHAAAAHAAAAHAAAAHAAAAHAAMVPAVLCANIEFWVILCNESIVLQASNPRKFQNFLQTHDFHYQGRANGVAQQYDHRRATIEKEKMEKASTTS
ncbi:hypothetical protein L6452_14829 [Arctium lappa]|uniref:Uncharacterized protein n=1 Tax=Arctium lappa TaxID=4217 RepID=A0ACB9CM46_ARCLA|nr:hypothetical protein L6452_14829 [Arctium lappa]